MLHRSTNPQRINATTRLAHTLIGIKSLTPVEVVDLPEARRCLTIAQAHAENSGAVTTRLEFEGGHRQWNYRVPNLYASWGAANAQRHLCYLGHLDVVSAGDPHRWIHNPFQGHIENGYLYGRGATDMKGSVAAFLIAMDEVGPELTALDLKVSMVLTADEEWAAINGSEKVLKWMRARGLKPSAFIVGEPSSQDLLGTHIKIGRRGSLVGTLTAKGVQGHAAYQELFENPNRGLGLALAVLHSKSWTDGGMHFPNTHFETIALSSGDFGASAIVPDCSQALWNLRFTVEQTPESLERWMVQTLTEPPSWAKAHPDFPLLQCIAVKANKDMVSLPYRSEPGLLTKALQRAIADITRHVPVLDASGGTTDGRFAAQIFPTAETIEFGLPERGGTADGHKDRLYRRAGGMHQVNERASLDDLAALRSIYAATIKNFGAQP